MNHLDLHHAVVVANLGRNPGCDVPACPLRVTPPTMLQRMRVAVARWPGLAELNRAVACWGFWVAVWFPLWESGELENPGQQYADPVWPIYACSLLFAGPTLMAAGIYRHLRRSS